MIQFSVCAIAQDSHHQLEMVCPKVLMVESETLGTATEQAVLLPNVSAAAGYLAFYFRSKESNGIHGLSVFVLDNMSYLKDIKSYLQLSHPSKFQKQLQFEHVEDLELQEIQQTLKEFNAFVFIDRKDFKRFLAPKDGISLETDRLDFLQTVTTDVVFIQQDQSAVSSTELLLRARKKFKDHVSIVSMWITSKPISSDSLRVDPDLAHLRELFQQSGPPRSQRSKNREHQSSLLQRLDTQKPELQNSIARGDKSDQPAQVKDTLVFDNSLSGETPKIVSANPVPAFLQRMDEFIDLVRTSSRKELRSRITTDRSLYSWWISLAVPNRYNLTVPWLLIFPRDVRESIINTFPEKCNSDVILASEKLGDRFIPIVQALPATSNIRKALLRGEFSDQIQSMTPVAGKNTIKSVKNPDGNNQYVLFLRHYDEFVKMLENTPLHQIKEKIHGHPELKSWFYSLHNRKEMKLIVPWPHIFARSLREKLIMAFSAFVTSQAIESSRQLGDHKVAIKDAFSPQSAVFKSMPEDVKAELQFLKKN